MSNYTIPTILKWGFTTMLITLIFLTMLLIINYTEVPKKSNITYLTYEDISTSIDERGRLHITNFKEETVTIYSDSVALGIHAHISNIIYKDYLEKHGK